MRRMRIDCDDLLYFGHDETANKAYAIWRGHYSPYTPGHAHCKLWVRKEPRGRRKGTGKQRMVLKLMRHKPWPLRGAQPATLVRV